MEYKFIGDSVNLLRGVEDFDEREFRGCSKAQIEALQDLLPEYFYLPDSYYEFLRFGGNGICDMLSGTDFYFPQIYSLTGGKKLQELKEASFFPESFNYNSYLTDDVFLFYYHQGYFIRLFYLLAGSDPNVFYYEAGLSEEFLLSQQQSFSQYLYTEVSHFIAQYQDRVSAVDEELKSRVKKYRCGLLDVLDLLDAIPGLQDMSLAQNARKRYSEILFNTYSIFSYGYRQVYESSYVFSPKNYINHQERENNNLQELIEMMYNLEKEGKQLVSYVRELKARDT